MSNGAILIIGILVLATLGGLFLVTTARKADKNAATGLLARETVKRDRAARRQSKTSGDSVAGFVPAPLSSREVERSARGGSDVAVIDRAPAIARPAMDPEQLGVARRQFLNRGIIAMFTLGLSSFAVSLIAFLWPGKQKGFGAKVVVGKLDAILAAIDSKKEPVYNSEARAYLVPYPVSAVAKAKKVYDGGVLTGMEGGLVAIYQKCVHLGCKVPWCGSSQWFECPCHGSQYNRVGEKKGGPAPRGLDRFAVAVAGDGTVVVDSGALSKGPAIGVNTTGQEAEGSHCVGGAVHH
jgi:cytochrome b6-f complex iron-sulfur subunit